MRLYHIIKNKQEYWLVDQKKQITASPATYRDRLGEIVQAWKREGGGFLSVMMDEAHEYWLLAKGFRKVTAIAEYTKELKEEPVTDGQIMAHSLAEGHISEAEYGALYEQCRSGSANKNEVQAVAEVMYMLQGELGPGWREYCHYFTTRGETVGISIPHIEPGTDSEGRMFYFGVMPNARGRGTGTKLHQHSLRLLRQLRASYYIGSTDVSNRDMIRVFEKNGCKQIDRKGIYRMEK